MYLTYLIARHDKEVGLFRQMQHEWFLLDWWFLVKVDLPNHRGNLLLRCCNKTLELKKGKKSLAIFSSLVCMHNLATTVQNWGEDNFFFRFFSRIPLETFCFCCYEGCCLMPCFVAALIVFLISDADVFKHVSNAIRKVFWSPVCILKV